jgi:hypothetical protein
MTDNTHWRPPHRGLAAGLVASLCGVVALLLAACGTAPPPRFHTLMPAVHRAGPPPGGLGLAWQMAPVTVPAQVDQPQWVVRRADDTLAVLEQERWIAPLQDELRGALVEHLSAQLGPPGARAAPGHRDWRVVLDVRRFDTTPARSLMVAEWALQAAAGETAALRCSSRVEQTALAGDIAALAAAHRLALAQLAGHIGQALRDVDGSGAAACP